jgi:hypothetical protein
MERLTTKGSLVFGDFRLDLAIGRLDRAMKAGRISELPSVSARLRYSASWCSGLGRSCRGETSWLLFGRTQRSTAI